MIKILETLIKEWFKEYFGVTIDVNEFRTSNSFIVITKGDVKYYDRFDFRLSFVKQDNITFKITYPSSSGDEFTIRRLYSSGKEQILFYVFFHDFINGGSMYGN